MCNVCGKSSAHDLKEANLSGANLNGANLRRANLNGANLSGANLAKANLSDANLSKVNLRMANLAGANLSGTDLNGANLSGANLSKTDLSEANLSGAQGIVSANFDVRGWNLVYNGEIYKAGCRDFLTLDEAIAHWGADSYHNKERGAQYVAMCECFSKMFPK